MITTQLDRIISIFNLTTQEQLASFLGIAKSRISTAKKRGELPPAWLLTLFSIHHVSPWWITHGKDPIHMRPESFPNFKLLASAQADTPVCRLRCLFDMPSDLALSEKLRLHAKTIQYWRQLGRVPPAPLLDLLMEHYVNPLWVVHGGLAAILVHNRGVRQLIRR